VDVGALVVANAQAPELVKPGKGALHDPSPPAQATAMRGAPHGQQGHDVTTPETAPYGRSVVAAIPEHTVRPLAWSAPFAVKGEESHPPTPGLLASRSGSRRSSEPRAARPAPRRSGGVCFRAWPDQWDLDRSGHRRTPHGWNNCPRPPATNQSVRRVRANPGAQNGSDPTRPPVASPASDASTSSPTRTRVPAGASVRECRCEGRRQCR
jgi:hypothetical protein